MDYNGLYTSLLLMRLSNGEYIPLPSVQASYGPFNSLEEARTDLVNTFKALSNVPRGYTFCVIENNKPQEYWFTKEGDWTSIEKKNTSSSSSTIVSGLVIEAKDGYLQVSYDNGDTWTKLVSLESLRGPVGNTGSPGRDGKDAVTDLSKIQIRMTSKIVTNPDPEDPEQTISYTEYKLEYTINGGVNWTNIGTIKSGSGGGGTEHIITIETYVDGNQYWKQDGNWMLDDQGNMVRANGKDGADGADGAGYSTQFKSIIFKRSNNIRIVNGVEMLQESEYPEGGTYNNPVPPSGNWYDGVPIGTAKLWMSTRWFSTNEAITDANNWSVPSPATDTADIDFEYSNAPLNEIPNDPGPNKNRNMYDEDTNPNGWYDGDAHSELLQNANWMTMRTCKNGFWNSWKTFKIRGESGESPLVPAVHFTSIVFRRSNNTRVVNGKIKLVASEYPQGGSYDSPVPTNKDSQNRLLWTDGLPVGNMELLWMSTRRFSSDGNHGEWTEPIEATDGANGYDFEWCDEETPTYAYPTRTSPDDNASGKIQDDPWYDEAGQNSDPIWMAMRPYEGNVYTSPKWVVMRVKGERGTDGTSFVSKGQLFGIFDTLAQARTYYQTNAATIPAEQKYAIVGTGLTSLYEFVASYTDGRPVTSLSIGDAYVNSGGAGKYSKVAGDLKEHIFIWDGDNFVDFGNIQGPEGKSAHFHIKYSNDGGNSFTYSGDVQDGETPGDYIGLRVDYVAADSMNPQDYLWSKFKGEDGFGYEYIFKLTANDTPPSVPTLEECIDYKKDEGTQDEKTVTYQDDDYVPGFLGWTDDPGSPTKALPYCWVAYRRKIDGQWTAYRGGSADSRYAALFSVYTSNGRGVDHIEEMYALGTSDTTAPALGQFGPHIPEFDFEHGLIYLWNYEVIYYDDDTTQTTNPECIAVSERGVGIFNIQEFYYACSFGDSEANDLQTHLPQWGGPNRSSAWKEKPMNVDKNNPFLWNFELITFTDGTQTWTDPVIIAYYVYTDVEYLMTIFKKVEGSSDTAYLGGLVGVVERGSDNNDVLRAMLNATNHGASPTHGKLIIASGFNGHGDVGNATFKVYEDGHVEMHDALIQGFLQQYYRNQQAIEDTESTYGNANNIRINPNKCSNYVMLGWQGLSVSGKYELQLSSSAVNRLYPGRVTFMNSIYIADNGISYYNDGNKPTNIIVNLMLPDGTLRSASVIVLRNGWVELCKVRSLDSNNNEVTPTLEAIQNVYMLYSYGGNVSMKLGNASLPRVNSNGAIVGYEQNLDYSISRFIDSESSIARVYPQNNTIYVNSDGTEDTLYIVMPRMKMLVNALGQVDYPEPLSWVFQLSGHHREIKFKVEDIHSKVPDADVPNLDDLYVAYGIASTPLIVANNSSVQTVADVYFRLTYYPFMNQDMGVWVAEIINNVNSI